MELQRVPALPLRWTTWMGDFMATVLAPDADGAPPGRAPCSAQERALGEARACVRAPCQLR